MNVEQPNLSAPEPPEGPSEQRQGLVGRPPHRHVQPPIAFTGRGGAASDSASEGRRRRGSAKAADGGAGGRRGVQDLHVENRRGLLPASGKERKKASRNSLPFDTVLRLLLLIRPRAARVLTLATL